MPKQLFEVIADLTENRAIEALINHPTNPMTKQEYDLNVERNPDLYGRYSHLRDQMKDASSEQTERLKRAYAGAARVTESEGENVDAPGYQPNRDPKMLAAEPNAQARFVAKHMVGKGAPRITDIDKSTLDDALFNATNIKRAVPDAGTNRHGHVPSPKDAKVYEDCTPAEQAAKARQKQKKMQTQVDETHAEAAHVSARHDINHAIDRHIKKKDAEPHPLKVPGVKVEPLSAAVKEENDYLGGTAELDKAMAKVKAAEDNKKGYVAPAYVKHTNNVIKPRPAFKTKEAWESQFKKEDIVLEAITSGGKKVMPRKPASQSEVDPEAQIEAYHDRTLTRHGEAIKRSKAEVYHEGWKQDFGPDKSCMHSKTSMGMLCTEHDHKTGAIKHTWSDEGAKK